MNRRNFLILTAATPLTACFGPDEQIVLQGHTMGTTYSVKYAPGSNTPPATALQAGIENILGMINGSMSNYDPQSELSRFNQSNSTEWLPVSTDLVHVLTQAEQISRLSAGAFDVTVAPLVNIWGFGPQARENALPDLNAIEQAKARVGYKHLHIDTGQNRIRKDRPELSIDLSGIAKGYGVDKLAEFLQAQSISRYLVEIGGELRLKGLNQNQQPWRIAIEEPTPGLRKIQKIVQLSDQSIATSGNYRNFTQINRQIYSHMLNPASGWPVRHDLASVSVISDTVMQADALATAMQVMGLERAYQLAESENIAAFFVTLDGEELIEHSSSAFRQYQIT